jgi:HD-like signal output (HDOD) protein
MADTGDDQNNPIDVGPTLAKELGAIKIPPRPAVLMHIEEEMRSKTPNLNKLGEIISLDVSISASLIKVSNSSFYGVPKPVRSVSTSLQILGLNTVGRTLAALYLRQMFNHVPNFERFWDASARTAQLSGWLANQLDTPYRLVKPDEAYTFGLFRDCGIPVMSSMLTDYFGILGRANIEPIKFFTDIEDDEIGMNHAQAGAILAREWRLPIEFQAAIEWHHSIDALRGLTPHLIPDISRSYIAMAQFSEHLFQQLTGLDKTCEWGKLGDACLEVLGIPKDGVEEFIELAEKDGVHKTPVI